jgi:phosphoribosylformimino-5-aminoimidazole carboxamide ribotide isomerase
MGWAMTRGFELLPAIDLRGGRVVRLQQGDFERETAYSDDPVAVAVAFAAGGAQWLHVVDLDGARTGSPAHVATTQAITAAVGGEVRVEVAGGLRTAAGMRRAFAAGASRVVLGTAALRDSAFAGAAVNDYGADRVVVAIDVRDGRASGDGWVASSATTDALEAISRLAVVGVSTFEVTAIDRDGLLGGPDLDLLTRAVELGTGRIIASAGIASVEDIAAVRMIGCAGAIVGRALYEGQLSLRDALSAAAAS